MRHLPASLLALFALASFPSRAAEAPLDVTVAGRFAQLALTCVHQEYPNKIAHVMMSDADALPPRKLTPAFYGCYDWHSAVHGHWLLARLARQFPAAPFAADAKAALGKSLTQENLATEVAYLEGKGRTSFERPYGLAWLLQLAAELHQWQDPDAQRWSAALAPLERAAAGRIAAWLPKLTRPIRVGEHDQTAFAFGLIWDWAVSREDRLMQGLLRERIGTYYTGDRLCPLAYEPGGQDFLSPCLAEADLLRRVLAPRDFANWLTSFLPAIPPNGSANWLEPAVVTDPTDPKLAHLDGLNLSRAWMLEGIAAGLPGDDLRRTSLLAAAAAHRHAGLAAVTGEHYEGGHWLGSFATYLVTGRGLPALTPCEVPGASEPVLCGTFEVWEDRTRAAGRKIPLKVIVVPATSAAATSAAAPADPVVWFEGGPGAAATARAGAALRAGPVRRRDILLIDQRGTGGSNALGCDLGGGRELFPPAAVELCARELSSRADLRLYTTEHFVDDVEEIRQRLGYGPLNLRGGSYGTRAMMVFAQRHPASTRTIFALGVDSPLRSNLAERGRWAERALSRLADLCAADPGCAALGPRVDTLAAEVLARVAAAPREVTLPDPEQPPRNLTLTLDRASLSEQLRLILYFAETARELPWALTRVAVENDWAPLARLANETERWFQTNLAYGLLFTVLCSENMAFDHPAALAAGAATLFGNQRLAPQIRACALWPHQPRPPLGVPEPRPLPIPTLLLSGALDPVTPPEYADDAATLLPNSRHLVLAEGHHGPFDLTGAWPCVHQIWADFLDRGAVEGLDVSCTEGMKAPAFRRSAG